MTDDEREQREWALHGAGMAREEFAAYRRPSQRDELKTDLLQRYDDDHPQRSRCVDAALDAYYREWFDHNERQAAQAKLAEDAAIAAQHGPVRVRRERENTHE